MQFLYTGLWHKAVDLKGKPVMVQTLYFRDKTGRIYTSRKCIRQKRRETK